METVSRPVNQDVKATGHALGPASAASQQPGRACPYSMNLKHDEFGIEVHSEHEGETPEQAAEERLNAKKEECKEEIELGFSIVTELFDRFIQNRAFPVSCTLPSTSTQHEPQCFTGTDKPGETRAEDWLTEVIKYAKWKGMSDEVLLKYFPLLLKDAASDWFDGLTDTIRANWQSLKDAFSRHFASQEVTKLRDAAELWSRTQKRGDSLSDYFAAMKKLAKYLPVPSEMLQYNILNGLSGGIKQAVMQQKYANIDEMLDIAKRAEIAIQSSKGSDPLLQAILEETKRSRLLAQDSKEEYKQLYSQVEALAMSMQPTMAPGQQVQQRQNYNGQQRRGRGRGGFTPKFQQRGGQLAWPTRTPCSWCGRQTHPNGECPARGMKCNKCQKFGHFGRVCRSQPQQNTLNFQQQSTQQQNSRQNCQPNFQQHPQQQNQQQYQPQYQAPYQGQGQGQGQQFGQGQY
jgi:hypothetical protein